jgi:transposase-like protein
MGKRWPADVKARALDLYATDGGAAASKATGVPPNTIASWARRETQRAGVALERAGQLPAPVEVAQAVPWAQRREPLVLAIGEAAVETLDATRRGGDGTGAKTSAVCGNGLSTRAGTAVRPKAEQGPRASPCRSSSS